MPWYRRMLIHLGLARRYEIGCLMFPSGDVPKARRDLITGEIQYVLWKAGEFGHLEDVWVRAAPGHKYVSETRPY